MSYIGIGPEAGFEISEENSFGYACLRCLTGTQEEQDMFMYFARTCKDIDDFAKSLVDWFFSGNWIHKNADKKYPYIIRFEGEGPRSFYGTFEDAVRSARKEAKGKGGKGYIIA